MNDPENKACQHVLECMEIFEDYLTPQIQDLLIEEIFPITLEQYPILCKLLVPRLEEYPILCRLLLPSLMKSLPMMVIHMAGEELKKQMPDHVSEIEQERVKYLTLIHGQLQPVQRVTFNLDCNRVYVVEDRKSDWMQRAADLFQRWI
jgi:hypothetical protein